MHLLSQLQAVVHCSDFSRRRRGYTLGIAVQTAVHGEGRYLGVRLTEALGLQHHARPSAARAGRRIRMCVMRCVRGHVTRACPPSLCMH